MNDREDSKVMDALRNAPIDDEVETDEESSAVDEARVWLRRNKAIPHVEAMRLLGLTDCQTEEDEITAETAAALDRARASLARGEGIAHEEVLREFNFTGEHDGRDA